MNLYLAETDIIDWQTPAVLEQAKTLAYDLSSTEAIAKACFHFVRDEVSHCLDSKSDVVTLTASEVLEHRTGYCYAKSHLLAALLRANGIPAGLRYQRLTLADFPKPGEPLDYCLHGLNAVYLPQYGWYKMDARGNKPGVDAQFCPPREQLAFALKSPGEIDFADIYTEPLPEVVEVLSQYDSIYAVADHLPDKTL